MLLLQTAQMTQQYQQEDPVGCYNLMNRCLLVVDGDDDCNRRCGSSRNYRYRQVESGSRESCSLGSCSCGICSRGTCSLMGFSEGFKLGFSNGLTLGFSDGLTLGFLDGLTLGFLEGFKLGFLEGFKLEFLEGFKPIDAGHVRQ